MSDENPALDIDEQGHEGGEAHDPRYDEQHFGAEHGEQIDYGAMPDQPPQYGYYDDDSDRRAPPEPQHDLPDSSAYGKIFVGGISWQTNEQNLRQHFEKYGDLDDVALMTDKRTGQPRGFGFVTFKDPSVVDVVLPIEHVIDGRTVDVKRAVPKDEAPAPTRLESKKVFVGGLAPSVSETEFREYFEPYGPVKEAIVMYDRQTNRSRGFGFITFEHEESVNKVMKDKQHEIMGKFVEVKRAEPRDARGPSSGGSGSAPERDDMYSGMYGGRYPNMYPGGGMRYPFPYGGRGGQYPPGFGYYGGFPAAYGMGAGGYGGSGRGMYGYGSGSGGARSGSMPRRDSGPERGGGNEPRDSRDDRNGGGSNDGRQPRGGPQQGGYRGMMMPMGYGYGYSGYGMYPSRGGQSQDQNYNETGYGGQRGQNRAVRVFRPY